MKTPLVLAAALSLLPAAARPQQQELGKVKELLQQLGQEVESLERRNIGKPSRVQPISNGNGSLALDTLCTENEAVKVVLYNDNTWRYHRIPGPDTHASDIFSRYWDTVQLFPYTDVQLSQLPKSVVIDLVDSLRAYHYPIKGTVYSKYGPRGRRQHQGVDIPLKTGDPVFATFDGVVRISCYNTGGYGNLVVVRHDNGLETWHGHLSERLVKPGQYVEAGQPIGLGGSTGRSKGPHLHYEIRYLGQSFDPQRLIDFEKGDLLRETFLLKRSYFDIRSSARIQDFDDEELGDAEERQAAAEKAAAQQVFHTIKSGDTLGAIARRYGVSVDKICKLNKISRSTTLRIGRKLRIR